VLAEVFWLRLGRAMCQGLAFSYGVEPVQMLEDPKNWRDFVQAWLQEHHIPGHGALLVAGPSRQNPDGNYRLEFLKWGEFRLHSAEKTWAAKEYFSG
jgi:hypothetical protein